MKEERHRGLFFSEEGEIYGLLKLGSWIYPLHPNVSPAFKTGYDAYIFPNNTSVGEFVGLMFDESVAPDDRYFFEDVLSKLSVFMSQPGTQTVSSWSIVENCLMMKMFSSPNRSLQRKRRRPRVQQQTSLLARKRRSSVLKKPRSQKNYRMIQRQHREN